MKIRKVYEVVMRNKTYYIVATSKKQVKDFWICNKAISISLRKDIDVDDRMLDIS